MLTTCIISKWATSLSHFGVKNGLKINHKRCLVLAQPKGVIGFDGRQISKSRDLGTHLCKSLINLKVTSSLQPPNTLMQPSYFSVLRYPKKNGVINSVSKRNIKKLPTEEEDRYSMGSILYCEPT